MAYEEKQYEVLGRGKAGAPGYEIHYRVYDVPTKKGYSIKMFEIFKPFKLQDGTWAKGRKFMLRNVDEVIDLCEQIKRNHPSSQNKPSNNGPDEL